MAQMKNQMDMIKDVEENKVVSADTDMEVVNYEQRELEKGHAVFNKASVSNLVDSSFIPDTATLIFC
jgi:hypothetical protein